MSIRDLRRKLKSMPKLHPYPYTHLSVRAKNVLTNILKLHRPTKRHLRSLRKRNVQAAHKCGELTFHEIDALVLDQTGRSLPDGYNDKLRPDYKSYDWRYRKTRLGPKLQYKLFPNSQ